MLDWNVGDLVIWDNLAIQHERPDFPTLEPRTMQRVCIHDKVLVDLVPNVGELLGRWTRANTTRHRSVKAPPPWRRGADLSEPRLEHRFVPPWLTTQNLPYSLRRVAARFGERTAESTTSCTVNCRPPDSCSSFIAARTNHCSSSALGAARSGCSTRHRTPFSHSRHPLSWFDQHATELRKPCAMLRRMTPRAATDPVTAVVAGVAGLGPALVETMDNRGDPSVVSVPAADDPAAVIRALEAVADIASVVHVCGDDTLASGRLASTDAAAWDAGCERVVWRALTTLQAAHAVLSRSDGGRIVMITATAGVSGAAGAVPLIAAVEGVRALAKSAARQWGAVGISVNCVSVPLELLAPAHAGLTTFLPPAALARPDPIDDVAGAVEFLCGAGAAGISGATLLVDGGAVMAP